MVSIRCICSRICLRRSSACKYEILKSRKKQRWFCKFTSYNTSINVKQHITKGKFHGLQNVLCTSCRKLSRVPSFPTAAAICPEQSATLTEEPAGYRDPDARVSATDCCSALTPCERSSSACCEDCCRLYILASCCSVRGSRCLASNCVKRNRKAFQL